MNRIDRDRLRETAVERRLTRLSDREKLLGIGVSAGYLSQEGRCIFVSGTELKLGLLSLREILIHRCHGVGELVGEVLQGVDEGRIAGVQHGVIPERRRQTRGRGPVPVRKRERRITAQLTANLFEPADVSTVPRQEPPVPVRAVECVDKSEAIPVARVCRRQLKHRGDRFAVAVQDRADLRVQETFTDERPARLSLRRAELDARGQDGCPARGQESTTRYPNGSGFFSAHHHVSFSLDF